MSLELIGAIAGLWKLALVILLITFLYLHRDLIKNLLEKLTSLSVKHGQTEMSMEKESGRLDQGAGAHQTHLSDDSTVASREEEQNGELPQIEEKATSEPFEQMIRAFLTRDVEGGNEAYKRLQKAESDTTEKLYNEALYLHLRYRCGDTSALETLLSLSKKAESNSQLFPKIYNIVGMTYEQAEAFSKAATAYETAAKAEHEDEVRAVYTVSASRCLFLEGNKEEAYRCIEEANANASPKALSTLYSGLASLYERDNNIELKAIALEKAIENSPNDTELLFDAAYAYSNEDMPTLSLLHYAAVLRFKPDNSMALNNVAITYGELQMPIHKVESLKKSIEHGETLASANLASQLLRSGFVEEATGVLDKAKLQENPHQNVGSALADLSARQDAEKEQRNAAFEKARRQKKISSLFWRGVL